MKAFRLLLALLVAGACFTMYSCVKKDFETPPDMSGYDPKLPVSMSIAELKTKFSGPASSKIDSDWTIAGTVISSDKSGNIYQNLYLEDSTGGIMLLLAPSDLYGRYPVGRKIYVKLKGLQYGYYGKFDQIGYGEAMSNIAADMVDKYVVPANVGNPVPMTHFDGLSQLKAVNPDMLGRLVHIDNIEVVAADTGKTYAVMPDIASATNINLEDCDGNKIVLRSSGYADFRGVKVPKGKGSITAIYTCYNSTPQLYIRDVDDIKFDSLRCGAISGTVLFNENFGSATSGDVSANGWTNFTQAGTQKWKHGNGGTAANKPYAQVTAFNSGQPSVISWLISPAINLAGSSNPYLIFKNANGYDKGATLKVYVSTNFSGDPATATWTQLNPILAPSTTTGYSDFVSSGNISLAGYTGNVYIAFKYEGGTTGNLTTTWEIDDVNVISN